MHKFFCEEDEKLFYGILFTCYKYLISVEIFKKKYLFFYAT